MQVLLFLSSFFVIIAVIQFSMSFLLSNGIYIMDITIIMIDLTAISSKFRRVIIGSLICFAHESMHEFPKKYFLNMFNVQCFMSFVLARARSFIYSCIYSRTRTIKINFYMMTQ